MRAALPLGELGPRIARIDTNADDPFDLLAAPRQSAANFESEQGKDMRTEENKGREIGTCV